MTVEDERALLVRARDGDVDAFGEFVRQTERRVRAVLWRLLDDERDLEEATQDAFVQAWRNLDRYRGDAAPFTWLYRIAVNEALMRLRRARGATVQLDDDVPTTPVARDEPETAGLQRALVECLRALPPDARAVVVLRDVEGLSNEEAAAVLEIGVPAVKSRLHRARMELRDLLVRSGAL